METLTTDEKKRMVKDLINNIPTTKGIVYLSLNAAEYLIVVDLQMSCLPTA